MAHLYRFSDEDNFENVIKTVKSRQCVGEFNTIEAVFDNKAIQLIDGKVFVNRIRVHTSDNRNYLFEPTVVKTQKGVLFMWSLISIEDFAQSVKDKINALDRNDTMLETITRIVNGDKQERVYMYIFLKDVEELSISKVHVLVGSLNLTTMDSIHYAFKGIIPSYETIDEATPIFLMLNYQKD